ncbi:MAG: hypothetical protein WBH75_05765, partial [Thermoanaerobaculia bacterium]
MAEPIENEQAEDTRDLPGRHIGQPFRRVDGRAKVTGTTRFADDLHFPRLCHLKLVRSTLPHA